MKIWADLGTLDLSWSAPPLPLKMKIWADLGTLDFELVWSNPPPPPTHTPPKNEKFGRSWHFAFELVWGPPNGVLRSSYVGTNFCIPCGYYLVLLVGPTHCVWEKLSVLYKIDLVGGILSTRKHSSRMHTTCFSDSRGSPYKDPP